MKKTVRELLAARNVSQKELCKKFNMSKTAVSILVKYEEMIDSFKNAVVKISANRRKK